jgi:hypothetical protein
MTLMVTATRIFPCLTPDPFTDYRAMTQLALAVLSMIGALTGLTLGAALTARSQRSRP